MGTPAQGHQDYIQIGLEGAGAWGTAVPATRKLGFVSETLMSDVSMVESQTMDGLLTIPETYLVKEMARGTITFEFTYEGLLMVLDMCSGTGTFGSAGGATTGTNPYTHVFKPKSILNSYTIEIYKNLPSGKCHRALGCKATGWRITGAAGSGQGAFLMLEVDIVAKKLETNQTPTAALTVATRVPALFHHATTVDDGTADSAADIRVRSFDLKVATALHDDRDYLGSTTPDEFLRSDRVRTTISFVKELTTRTLLDAYKAGGSGSPKLIFGSGAFTFTLDIPAARIAPGGYSETRNGYGIEMQEVTWQALRTSDHDLLMTVVNTESAIA